MEESDTYLAIVDEGREKQAKSTLLRLGTRRFGPASPAAELAIQTATDLDRLVRMLDHILDATELAGFAGDALDASRQPWRRPGVFWERFDNARLHGIDTGRTRRPGSRAPRQVEAALR